MAANGLPSWRQIFWITAAMVGARSAAMGFNRWADRRDQYGESPDKNAGVAPRARFPQQVVVFTTVASTLFIIAAYELNPLALYLSPIALGTVFFYSYTKRFAFLSHAFLGLALRHPLGAWIAVTRKVECARACARRGCSVLASGVRSALCDSDIDFDRKTGLHSIPQRFCIRHSLWK